MGEHLKRFNQQRKIERQCKQWPGECCLLVGRESGTFLRLSTSFARFVLSTVQSANAVLLKFAQQNSRQRLIRRIHSPYHLIQFCNLLARLIPLFCSPSLPYKNSEVQLCCQTRPPRFRFPFHVKHRLNAKVLPLFDIRCAHQLPIRRIFSPLGSLRNCCASFAASFEIFLEKRWRKSSLIENLFFFKKELQF